MAENKNPVLKLESKIGAKVVTGTQTCVVLTRPRVFGEERVTIVVGGVAVGTAVFAPPRVAGPDRRRWPRRAVLYEHDILEYKGFGH